MKADTSKYNNSHLDTAIYEHIADYIIHVLIKEDVNAFNESKLLSELLVYKLPSVVHELMYRTICAEAGKLKGGEDINLIKEIGGINTQKRLHFRSQDQYNSFVALFFDALEQHPGLLEKVDDEEKFEKFMIYCIHEFRQKLEGFAIEIVKEHSKLEQENRLYIHRRNSPENVDIPTYADFIAGRIDGLVE
ncbi:MAG TPA: hypothetical protein VMC84_07905 [Methanocella sp.]|uniref:hypothetical protein n=1 Tax=Methanocella sp. TaxID=2052833 RepID=UPI002D084568|nr:hypothetical protein [Methanocella sp.]HTY91083.1 hypothetical protein [Methanocella sp.]